MRLHLDSVASDTLIYAIFFLSGVSALIFQHIWFRQAGLVFGNSVWASSLVLASFMAGLALGNSLAARWRSRTNPLLLYSALELTVALTGVSLVFVLPGLGEGLVPSLVEISGGGLALGAFRFGLGFMLLVVPTAAMGMTLPLLASRTPSRELFGVTLGRLYGWNTLGAVFGALAGEAILYEWIGVRYTAYVAGGLNIAAALLSLALARAEHVAELPPQEIGGHATGMEIRLLAIAAVAGASFLALEVIWTRFMLLFVFGNALTFAIILALALAGMSIGSLLASRSPRLCDAPQAAPMLALLCSIAVTGSYVTFADVLRTAVPSEAGAWARVGVLSAALILPAAVGSGALFTCLGAALVRKQTASRATGLLTLSNTLGAMIGAIVAGFVLLPMLGMEKSFWTISAAYLVAAFIAPGFLPLLRQSRALLLATLIAALFTAFFPHGLMASTYLRGGLRAFLSGSVETRVTGFREGLTETITYVDALQDGETLYTRLVTNSFSMSGTTFAGRRYMETFVFLPVAIHPHVRRALLISYGVGSTARALTETNEIEKIDVVDISKDILEMASLGVPPGEAVPLSDPRVATHIEDGRFFLQTAREGYDLITSEPPPPHLGGVVNLYTRQYFDLMRRRLNPGGIVSYWLPVHSLSDDDSRAITSAFCSAFADCTLWKGMDLDWILLGTNGLNETVAMERFNRQWADGGPEDLRDIGLEVPEQLGALFMAEGATLKDLTARAPLDDNYPGRLSRAPPPLSLGPWKESLMDAAACRERFLASEFVKRIWPAEMRAATVPYFDVQRLYDQMLRNIIPDGSKLTPTKDAVSILRGTSLKILPTLLLGTTGEMRLLVNRLEPQSGSHQDKGWLHAHLATRDVGERRYDSAAAHLRRALALDATSPGLRERLVLTLCLQGKTAEGAIERQALTAPPDADWDEALDDACGARPRPPKAWTNPASN